MLTPDELKLARHLWTCSMSYANIAKRVGHPIKQVRKELQQFKAKPRAKVVRPESDKYWRTQLSGYQSHFARRRNRF